MPATIDPVNAITLLGFIEEAPRSGYDLKRAIDERLEQLLEMTSGTVYYTLKRMEARGWVKGSVSRKGKRPEQRVYRITPGGSKAFAELLEQALSQGHRIVTPFDIALYFTPRLPPETVVRAVDKHLADLDRLRDSLHTLEQRFPVRWPFHLYYLREKAKEIAGSSERWWLKLRKKVEERASVKG
ncbi:MAG TPA: PadR family transcriptional regulator [Planctomycetota bacterium]|nr:PadR family transcriptional regulator [Planctomycetota bacterium]